MRNLAYDINVAIGARDQVQQFGCAAHILNLMIVALIKISGLPAEW